MNLDELLARIAELDAKATPGKWVPTREPPPVGNAYFDRHTDDGSHPIESRGTVFALGVAVGVAVNLADAEWIALSRTALPLLAAKVREMREAAMKERDTFDSQASAERAETGRWKDAWQETAKRNDDLRTRLQLAEELIAGYESDEKQYAAHLQATEMERDEARASAARLANTCRTECDAHARSEADVERLTRERDMYRTSHTIAHDRADSAESKLAAIIAAESEELEKAERRLEAAEKAIGEVLDMMSPKNRQQFVMRGPLAFAHVYQILSAASEALDEGRGKSNG